MQFQSFHSTLNARMYLYDTPRDTMAKDPMLQSLCSTPTWNAPELMPNISKLYFSCVPELYAQHNVNTHVLHNLLLNTKHLINHVLQSPFPTQTFHQPCASGSMPNTKHIYTYISSTIGLRPIYKTNHHVHM